MQKIFLLFFIPTVISVTVSSQPAIQWDKTIGGSSTEYQDIVRETADGGYLVGGYSASDSSGDKTQNSDSWGIWVVKLNKRGNLIWQRTIGGNKEDELFGMEITPDGGAILAGASNSDISGDKTESCRGGKDFWVIKLDKKGEIQWDKTIGGNRDDLAFGVDLTKDGGYIVAGASGSHRSGDKTENNIGEEDYWLVKLNANGSIQWQNTIGSTGDEYPWAMEHTIDGGSIIGGTSKGEPSGDKTAPRFGEWDYWVVKTDSLGKVVWDKSYGGAGDETFTCLQQTDDEGFIIGGSSDSRKSGNKTERSQGDADYWVLKLDKTGNIQWQNTIGGVYGDGLYGVQQTMDGGFILGGYSNSTISGDKTYDSYNGGTDYWIVKIDSTGSILWQKVVGGAGYDAGHISIRESFDKGFIISGISDSGISYDKTEPSRGGFDYWIVKLKPDVSNPAAQIKPHKISAGSELRIISSEYK